MAGPVVIFDNVSKRFRRGEMHNSLRDLMPHVGKRLLGRAPASEDAHEFWAVQNASFEVAPGEALGIIGGNGAGKSTTLKLLSRILKPTRGRCAVFGRVGALIEVAAGFHPDLTGRENIYLQGAVMGMKRREITAKLDKIVDFAGVADFLDTPTKRYSSGMNARLGFSIAAHMDPDVLLIDEVLAVGDLAFQEQCYRRMQEFRRSGVAIIFVSHNLSAVASVCDRVALFERGCIKTIGTPSETFTAYARKDENTASATGHLLEITTPLGEPAGSQTKAGSPLAVRASIRLPATPGTVAFSLRVKRVESGQHVYLTTTPSLGCDAVRAAEPQTVEVMWWFNANLSRGHYVFEVAAFELANRQELTAVASAPIAVHEDQSEQGTTFLASRCHIVATESEQERSLQAKVIGIADRLERAATGRACDTAAGRTDHHRSEGRATAASARQE